MALWYLRKRNLYLEKRNIAFKNQSGRCYYCGAPMWQNDTCEEFARLYGISTKKAKRLQCTAEHLIAQCDGGKHTQENIVAACLWCNRRRHQHFKNPKNHMINAGLIAKASGDLVMPGSKTDYKEILNMMKKGSLPRSRVRMNVSRLYRTAKRLEKC